jgi:hypothetical protein
MKRVFSLKGTLVKLNQETVYLTRLSVYNYEGKISLHKQWRMLFIQINTIR